MRAIEKPVKRSYDPRYLTNDPPLKWYVQLPGAAEDDCPHYTTRQKAIASVMEDFAVRENRRHAELVARRLDAHLFPAGHDLVRGIILPGTTPGGAMLCKALYAKQWEAVYRLTKRNTSIWGGLDNEQRNLVLGQADFALLGFGIELSDVASIEGGRREWALTIAKMLLDREVKL